MCQLGLRVLEVELAMTGTKKDRGDVLPSSEIVRFAPMHDQILPHLRRDIVENRWKSGERLSEPLLCKQFGVSRTPLRVALKTLESDGLIRLVPQVDRERHSANEVEPVAVESAESRHEIVDAILAHRPEAAGVAMRKHLENVSRLMLASRMAAKSQAPVTPVPVKSRKKASEGRHG